MFQEFTVHNISEIEGFYLNEGSIKKFTIKKSLRELLPLRFVLASTSEEKRLWDKLIDRYHYLGYSRIPGKRLKYLIFSHDNLLLAAIGWKSGSIQLFSRDTFIGWPPSCREKNIDRVTTNIRFIIFPWVTVYNLASKILGKSIYHLKIDWKKHYNKDIYFAETFIDPTRFAGTCYKAANWKYIGLTRGYSKIRGGYTYHGNKKEVFIYVIKKNFRKVLQIKTPYTPGKTPSMSVLDRLQEVQTMTFQNLNFNPDLIDNTIWSDELFSDIAEELRNYYRWFYPAFSRTGQMTYGELYIQGLLSPLERKHIEGIALYFQGPEKVRGLQKFMKDSPWDHECMHRLYLDKVSQELSSPEGMFTLDSSENAKKGKESVGVSRQYCGNTGKLDNCQSGVFLGYAADNGYTLLDRRLYMPEKWFTPEYEQRRKECMIPDTLEFKTKLDISLEILKNKAIRDRFDGKWVGADAYFGSSMTWCDEIEKAGFLYFASIRENQLFWLKEPKVVPLEYSGRGRPPQKGATRTDSRPEAVKNIIKHKNVIWKKVILAEGTKGPIAAEVTILRVIRCEDNLPTKKIWLIVRRDEDGSLHYYISNAPKNSMKKIFYRVLTMRWSIEQCFEDGKKYLGMDHYEHRSWPAWHRHMLFVFLSMFFLHILRIKYKKNSSKYSSPDETTHTSNIYV